MIMTICQVFHGRTNVLHILSSVLPLFPRNFFLQPRIYKILDFRNSSPRMHITSVNNNRFVQPITCFPILLLHRAIEQE
ncbi:hypothetical protein PBCV1_a460R [Paramecium bursaria Chlorella virus 1]|uniref:Uncharacterized protein n=1 Tax=Paramecium bursaria Chlorella virus 1 TaxID=10506 RepID=Q98511_PBCV1|nr:hypothetical protein PBCV1_a460R [Paramecium bursaria Chlorella virus 1]AAC96828.1 hypothetical protein [Paramecium bursaria Chlorella virus 1]